VENIFKTIFTLQHHLFHILEQFKGVSSQEFGAKFKINHNFKMKFWWYYGIVLRDQEKNIGCENVFTEAFSAIFE